MHAETYFPSTLLNRETTVHNTNEITHSATKTGCSTHTPCYIISSIQLSYSYMSTVTIISGGNIPHSQ